MVLWSMVCARDARAHRPPRADAWWAGLDGVATTDARSDTVRVLRPPQRGRVRVPGGTFTMGSTPAAMGRAIALCEHEVLSAQCHEGDFVALVRAEGFAHAVTLSGFELDRTEVSVADYGRCVSAGACAPAEMSTGVVEYARPELPITHVRWQDAVAFCGWRGGRLPSEAEWEFAARGVEGRDFPWGQLYNTHLANHGAWAGDRTDGTDGFLGLSPVGSFPDGATPLGLLDMAGNVAEWVADLLELDAAGHPVGYGENPEVDPKPKSGGGAFHIVRGGSYLDAATWLRSAARDATALPRAAWVGFRCAADVR